MSTTRRALIHFMWGKWPEQQHDRVIWDLEYPCNGPTVQRLEAALCGHHFAHARVLTISWLEPEPAR